MPNSISSAFLGAELPSEELETVPLHRMSDGDLDRFIRRCASALKSHASEYDRDRSNEDALGAFESTIALLLEVRDVYPAKREAIDDLLASNGATIVFRRQRS